MDCPARLRWEMPRFCEMTFRCGLEQDHEGPHEEAAPHPPPGMVGDQNRWKIRWMEPE